MIIAFDFDGTITKYNEYPKCGELRQYIEVCIQKLVQEGHKILIFTCRDTQHLDQLYPYIDMVEYLIKNNIPFDTINRNVNPSTYFNPIKPYWNILVEDTSLGWNNNWTGLDIYEMIQKRIKSDEVIKENIRTNNYKN
jgi:hypothetical protein